MAALLLSSGLAACGHGSAPSQAAFHNRAIAFAQCMRANGVPNFPDPGSGGGLALSAKQTAGSGPSLSVNGTPVSAPAFRSAIQRCHGKLPRPNISSQQLARFRSQALTTARCMRSHGVPNFPDPTFRSGPLGRIGIQLGPGPGVDPSSPAFQAAARTCMSGRGGGFQVKTAG